MRCGRFLTIAKRQGVIIYQRTSPDPNFIPPSAFVWRYSSAWLDPWQGGIKSLKHKQSSAPRQSGQHICRYNQENKKSTKIRIWCCSASAPASEREEGIKSLKHKHRPARHQIGQHNIVLFPVKSRVCE